MTNHWVEFRRHWDQVGPPLRPSSVDIAWYLDGIDRWAHDHGPPRALILGVTPELYDLPWPKGTSLLAMDHTPEMITALWPGPRHAVVCADWRAMPLTARSRDIVLCDGGISLLDYPHGQEAVVRTLRRVVAPGGLCMLRLFVPPARRETPDAVLRDLLAGRIANLNLLKLRLAMALQKDFAQGVPLKRVWEAFHRAAPDFGGLAARLGWSLDHLSVINVYRDSDTRYYYLRVADVCGLFCGHPGGFTLERVEVPTYELGERCPIVVLRRDTEDGL